MDAWALTDHGNGNGLAHAHSAAVKLQKKGKKYRQLYGIEFYFVSSLTQWKLDYEAHKKSIKDAKSSAEAEKLAKRPVDEDADEEEQGGHVVEDEAETKDVAYATKPEWQKRYHLVAVAKNRNGLSNLFRLVKASFKDGFYRYPRIDFDLLKKWGSDIVWSSACLGGIGSQIILRGGSVGKSHAEIMTDLENMSDRFVEAVGEKNFFLELQFNKLDVQHTVNKHLIDLSRKTGLKLLATCDSHYPDPSKWQARELYKKLGWMGAKLDEHALPKFEDLKCELYPKNASQMWEEYKKSYEQHDFYSGTEEEVRDAIERTHDIAWNECEDTWIDTKAKLPRFGTPEKSAMKQLVELLKEKMIEQGLADNPVYVARLKEELEVVKAKQFEDYFLTLYKIFQRASKRAMLGSGRGSGTGSLINYILGITNVDPIKYGLLFSRFINMGRKGFPDVDTDISDRDVLIEEARNLFGDDAVIPVTNFNLLKTKSLLKDLCKIFGVPFEEANALTNTLQQEVEPFARGEDVEKSVFVLTHDDCMKYSEKYRKFMEKYPQVAEYVTTLFSQNRSLSRHAGGILIADPDELAANMPIISVRGELQTAWTEGMNWRNLEDNGFLKFDFLGLTLLKDIENCIRRILIKQGCSCPTYADITKFFDDNFNCRYHEPTDQRVYDRVFRGGAFTGVFQFTQDGARKFCIASKPKTIDELAAITAIYRPGPLKANVHKKYVESIESGIDDHIINEHSIIKEVLGPTHGFLTFQESWMVLAQKLSGFTDVEADEMRKTLVKKSLDTNDKKAGERVILREKFVKGAKTLNGLDEKISNDLFDKIEFFSLYGFSKNHSVPYVIDSYYAAWLHTHYEKEWLATILQSESSNPTNLSKTISEIKSLGYKFSKHDINYSGVEWQYSEEAQAFVPPLGSVKGLGSAAVDEIMANRPYKDLNDLLYSSDHSWRHSKMNKTAFSALCKIEAFESLADFSDGRINNHKQLLTALTDDKNYESLRKGLYGLSPAQLKKAQKSGDNPIPLIEFLLDELRDVEDWTRAEKIEMAYELTSTVDADLLFPPELLQRITDKDIPRLHDIPAGSEGIGWFCAASVEKKTTKNGKTFYKCKALDDDFRTVWLRIWGTPREPIEPYTLWVGKASHDANWGFSSSVFKMRQMA